MVHASRGRNQPASEHLRSEPWIVAQLARATFPDSTIPWEALVADYARVRACIEAVLPIFADYEKRVREPGGFALKNTARDREWKTETGRARFMAHPVPRLAILRT